MVRDFKFHSKLFSPDFLNFFKKTAHLLKDPTVWCISSWNDFGFKHLVDDHNRFIFICLFSIRLFRTQYFPGLGWMIDSKIWESIEKKFPTDLWDEGMRVSTLSKNRDCIVPEISRNKNIGIVGANMNPKDFALKIQPLAFNKETKNDYVVKHLGSAEYENYMKDLVGNSKFIKNLYDITGKGNVYTLPFKSMDRTKIQEALYIPLDEFRSHHQQTVILKYRGNTLILAHNRLSPYLPKTHKLEKNPSLKIVAAAKCNKFHFFTFFRSNLQHSL
jgi:alpha-1,3-mannosyl-glycoprotein beta-1,2-N-acetylglucosaminyltransferase